MKKHNELVRFKNSFLPHPQLQETLTNILSDDLSSVLKNKLEALVQLYKRTTADEGYNQKIAYRVITICLLSENKQSLNLTQEVSRLFKYCLKHGSLDRIGLCFDLLLLKQIKDAVKEEHIRVFKIRLLNALRDLYHKEGKKQEKRKCEYTLQEYCLQALQKEYVKRNIDVYEEVLDTCIDSFKRRVSRLVASGSQIKAIESLSQLIGVLQKSQQVVSSKYQQKLMEAYWALAKIHDQLHYLAYTRKYASIALNIAERIQEVDSASQLRRMLQSLT